MFHGTAPGLVHPAGIPEQHKAINLRLSKGYRSVLKNAAFVYASLLINQVSRAVYVVVLARILGPDLYGMLSYGQAWYLAFLPLALLGMGPLLAHAVGRDREEGARIANLVASIRIVTILVTAIVSGVMGISVSDSPAVSTLMIVFAIALVGRAASLWADEMYQAYEVNRFSFNQAKVFRTTEVLLGMVLALLTRDVVWVAVGHALVWVAQGAWGLFQVIRHLQPLAPRWHWLEVRLLLITGIPLGLSNVFGGLMIQGGIILYKGAGAENELVGNLAINVQALMILGSLFVALSRAALPAVSRSVARGDANHRIYVSVMIRSAFVFGALAAVWALAIGADIVKLVLGPHYQTAGQWLWLMLWGLVPYIIKQAVTNALVAHGSYGLTMWINLVGALSMAAAVLVLIEPYGFAGVVVGMLVGFTVDAAFGLLVMVRMKILDHVADIPKLAAVLALMVSIYLAVASYQPLAAAILATVVLVFGVILSGIVRGNEKEAIWRLIRRRA